MPFVMRYSILKVEKSYSKNNFKGGIYIVKIALIDDQIEFLDLLKSKVTEVLTDSGKAFEIKTYEQPGELLSDVEAGRCSDIFLIDVEMPECGGFELAQRIRLVEESVVIIFVTSHEELGLDGYKYCAWRYLLKDKLDSCLGEALNTAMTQLYHISHKHGCYIIQDYRRTNCILHKDIYYIHIDGKYSYFHTRQGIFYVRKSLNTVYQELDSQDFIFIDKKYVVNIRHVIEVSDQRALMRGSSIALPISRPQYKKVRRAVSEYCIG